jgi:glyoxylase-like metal-dependent hydrolase (beta-lactamase superfamily II)
MQQISRHLYQISLGMVNAFIIEDDGLTLIDTGLQNSQEKIFTAIRNGGRNPNDIKRIILTHAHSDHAGSAAAIKTKLNIPVFAHTADAQLIKQGLAGRQPMHLTPGALNWLIYHLVIRRAGNTIKPVRVEETLNDNDILPIAGGIQAIHTPGHSAGHIALLLRSEGVLIAGDICANAAGLGLSIVYEDQSLGINSILKAAALDFDTAVFGHGKPLRQSANRKIKEKFTSISNG